MADESGEKTEEATQARRDEFRKRGQVPNTKELGSALILLTMFILIYVAGKYFLKNIFELFEESYGSTLVSSVRNQDYKHSFMLAMGKFVYLFGPLGIIAVAIGIMSNVFQTGLLQVEDALTPKLEKINPLNGIKRIFSLKSVVEGIKSILKIILIIFLIYTVLKKEVAVIPRLMDFSPMQMLDYSVDKVAQVLGLVAVTMLVLAAFDYFYQKWELEKEMMMTKQEVKEEHKSREGDPMIKSRIRRIQRDMANRRMMQNVPKADVIVTNPTHIAVALRYDKNLPAPQLIAKGGDLVAEKIKAIAREHGIPIVENKPLARTIFKTLEIGQVIPKELFVAVAEVLSYVYKIKNKVMS